MHQLTDNLSHEISRSKAAKRDEAGVINIAILKDSLINYEYETSVIAVDDWENPGLWIG